MKKRHPRLTRLQRTRNIINCDDKPRFKLCKDIYEFFNRYRTWFQDEVLLLRSNRTDMEHIKYIFVELGETFKDAWNETRKFQHDELHLSMLTMMDMIFHLNSHYLVLK